MKTAIHPDYQLTEVSCSCGNHFITNSVLASLRVEVCSECHPFYTGQQRVLDTGGRVDRFNRRKSKAVQAA